MKDFDMFKFTEKCLYDYKMNMAGLEILRSDLQLERSGSDVHAQNYQAIYSSGGTPSKPVETRMQRIEHLEEQIRRLERQVEPITRLMEDLKASYVHEGSMKADLLPLMELFYFGQNTLPFVLSELHISKPILYKRRCALVRMLMGYMGHV